MKIFRLCEAQSLLTRCICQNDSRVIFNRGCVDIAKACVVSLQARWYEASVSLFKISTVIITRTVLDYLYHTPSGKYIDHDQRWLD